MKKIFIFVCLIITFSSTYTFFDKFFNFPEYAEKQKKTVVDLDKYIKQINVSRSIFWAGSTMIIRWNYRFKTDAAYASFNQYCNAHTSLTRRSVLDSLSKAFVLGLVAFLSSKFLNYKIAIGSSVLGGIGIVMHQNAIIGVVPYFNNNLIRYDNEFNNFNLYTWTKIYLVWCIMGLSYFSSYLLENLYYDFK